MHSLRSSSLTPFAPAVLASRVFVLPAAPSNSAPHSDRTSPLPSLAAHGSRLRRSRSPRPSRVLLAP